ncbi:MAG: hypothetical protein ETSY2_54695 [Candidatus Entotheonella gemina]|uniref:Uncharacterized protein n=1 Tax=Candidatus Entotheonella gemina TaxID=1429439 RepID=W4L3Z3_9BACT|nr:MAG: hypothetical protein ETSY2_54695 [Candidatus Entotheonella gemina]
MRQEFALATAAFFGQQQIIYRPDCLYKEGLEIFRKFRRR